MSSLCSKATVFLLFLCGAVPVVLWSRPAVAEQDANEAHLTRDAPPPTVEVLEALERGVARGGVTAAERAKALRAIAHDYYRIGKYDRSFSLFEEIAESGADLPVRVDAVRMLGQISLLVRGDLGSARTQYERMASMTAGLPEGQRRSHLGEALEKLAMTHDRLGDRHTAIRARQRMLQEASVGSFREAIAVQQMARDYSALGRHEDAVKSFDVLLNRYPGFFARNPGSVVNTHVERVLAHGLPRIHPRKLELLREVWENDDYAKHLEVFNVGRQAVFQADQLNDAATLVAIANDFMRRLEPLHPNLTPEQIRRYGLDDAYAQVVLTLANHHLSNGDLELALALYERLLAQFPEGSFVEHAKEELEQLRERTGTDIASLLAEVADAPASPAPPPVGLPTHVAGAAQPTPQPADSAPSPAEAPAVSAAIDTAAADDVLPHAAAIQAARVPLLIAGIAALLVLAPTVVWVRLKRPRPPQPTP